jgi:hypothetical protein
MDFKRIGEPLFAQDPTGRPLSRVGTVFLRTPGLVTLPGVHAMQRLAWVDGLNADRVAAGAPPLSDTEQEAEFDASVDLLLEGSTVLIRPDPSRMDLAFQADDFLQTFVSKRRIRFLNTANETIREALRRRGENWRMSPLPQTQEEIIALIADARTAIENVPIYYYNRVGGTRYLTCESFRWLAALEDATFRLQLDEIARFSTRRNRLGHPEIDVFPPGCPFDRATFAALAPLSDALPASCAELRRRHAALAADYEAAVPPILRADAPGAPEWRRAMCAALVKQPNAAVSDEIVSGLSAEFYLQIEWLPGARIEDGELIFDPLFDECAARPDDAELRALCDFRARGMIFNYVREFREIEYINIGRISRSLSRRVTTSRRPTVYIAEVQHTHADKPVVRILRLQKWGIAEHLDEGKDLLQSIIEAEAYTDYILDRRLGCQQLGMNLPPQIVARRINETYTGTNARYVGQTYWITYLERPYLYGWASAKIPPHYYANTEFNRRLAALLGAAAATNLILGRTRIDTVNVLFDDGDEIVLFDDDGLPQSLVVSDHTGTFSHYLGPLADLASAYAAPVNWRAGLMPNASEFAACYLAAFVERFDYTRGEYLRRKRAFDTLFIHRVRDVAGSFAYRWECVLNRLAATSSEPLAAAIRNGITAVDHTLLNSLSTPPQEHPSCKASPS